MRVPPVVQGGNNKNALSKIGVNFDSVRGRTDLLATSQIISRSQPPLLHKLARCLAERPAATHSKLPSTRDRSTHALGSGRRRPSYTRTTAQSSGWTPTQPPRSRQG